MGRLYLSEGPHSDADARVRPEGTVSVTAHGAWLGKGSAGRPLALGLPLDGEHVQDFEEVFRLILPRAGSVARRILGNETQAEDAAAEALARAHLAWKKVGSSPCRDAWICV